MDSSKSNFRCIVCDVETSSLCNLHKHQTLRHTSEELSLSLLTLQSFIYHKHYFETLDSQIFREKCYFYPFCTQLLSTKNENAGLNSSQQFSHGATQVALKTESEVTIVSTVIKEPEKCKEKPAPLKRLQASNNPSRCVKNPETSSGTQSASVSTSGKSDCDAAFQKSASALCDDLIKLKGKTKVKRKRLIQTREPPSKVAEGDKQIVKKTQRKLKIDKNTKECKTVISVAKPEDTEVLKIWVAKDNEGAFPTVVSSVSDTTDTVQQIKLQSPGIPANMVNSESALIFNSEIGTFQWNPLNFVEKKNEGSTDVRHCSGASGDPTRISQFL